ncbi:MAG: GNAT family N-acetyltransferase [Acidimicrobiales bacterium]
MVDLRPASPGDAPALARILRRSRRHTMPHLPDDDGRADPVDRLAGFIDGDARVTVARLDGGGAGGVGPPAGFSVTTPGRIHQLCVDPEHEAVGVGGVLLRALLAEQPGGVRVRLGQRDDRSRRFYERYGFLAESFVTSVTVPDMVYHRPGGRLRPAARALMVDPDRRVFLVRLTFPQGSAWVLPGGGIHEGETTHEAVRRELAEEVGWAVDRVGPLVWHRTVWWPERGRSGFDGQQDRVVLLPVPAFEPRPELAPAELTAEHITAMRWWTKEEMRAAEVRFSPLNLLSLIPMALNGSLVECPTVVTEGVRP